MTQNLLDTTTVLLNSTKSDLNLGSTTKNYTETFSNGKSFNDILSNANSNYIKDNKTSLNNSNLNKNNNNNTNAFGGNKNSQNLNSSKNSVTEQSSVSPKNGADKINQNKQSSSNQEKIVSSDNSNVNKISMNESETRTSKVNSISETDNKTSIDSDITVLDETGADMIGLATTAILDTFEDNTDSFVDVNALNQMLFDEDLQEESAQADFYINAFYQSTLDSLNESEINIQDVDLNSQLLADTASLTSLAEDTTLVSTNELFNDLSEETSTTVETVDIGLSSIEKINQSSTVVKQSEVNNSTENTDLKDKILTSSQKHQGLKDVSKTQDAFSNSEEVQTSSADLNGVEVDTFTNEDNNLNNDILVNVSDDVMQQEVQPVVNEQNKNKLSFREVMEKAGLDEAKLEALNLNVTSAGSEENEFGGNLGQGSAQDDIARLSLETQGKKDLISTQNKDFSKIVDTKQTLEEQPKEISKNDILAQVNNKMQAQNINGTKKITLQLTPESLGKITIEIMKGKDGLQAKMLTDNYQVKEMLDKNIDGLKSTLSNQGITVNNVSVKVSSASESSSEFSFGRDNSNGESSQQQNFAGTGERKGENNSHYSKASAPETDMTEDETLAINSANENTIQGTEISGDILSNSETEKILAGTGNVDIEV